ncbi:MAG: YlbF family regulator [Oscillospiraceae bacterium]|nr:YlbF family regulator [Oscillospiraceae bacterium]
MDIIEQTRELGKLIQQETSYIKLKAAEKDADADQELQNLIQEFNLKRLSINNETQKAEKDQEKIKELNDEMQKVYADIMSNKNMIDYNNAKQEFDQIITRVMTILQNCAQGEDPETTDYTPSCSGSCATCGGCG